jgi:hypothetical protein
MTREQIERKTMSKVCSLQEAILAEELAAVRKYDPKGVWTS